MVLGKIGAKSASFINHKPFHPGSFQNLERVWQAEENFKKEQQKQKELEERRTQEAKIHELRETLRRKGSHPSSEFSFRTIYKSPQAPKIEVPECSSEHASHPGHSSTKDNVLAHEKLTHRNVTVTTITSAVTGSKQKNQAKGENPPDSAEPSRKHQASGSGCTFTVRSRYREDHFPRNHTTAWGSYFDRERMQWGFQCCKIVGSKQASCSANPPQVHSHRAKKRKNLSTGVNEASDVTNKAPKLTHE